MIEPRDQERLDRAAEERERLRLAYPAEFTDGARRGYSSDHLYPSGFNDWPLERRNAWFAGWNKGYLDRKKRESGDGR